MIFLLYCKICTKAFRFANFLTRYSNRTVKNRVIKEYLYIKSIFYHLEDQSLSTWKPPVTYIKSFVH